MKFDEWFSPFAPPPFSVPMRAMPEAELKRRGYREVQERVLSGEIWVDADGYQIDSSGNPDDPDGQGAIIYPEFVEGFKSGADLNPLPITLWHGTTGDCWRQIRTEGLRCHARSLYNESGHFCERSDGTVHLTAGVPLYFVASRQFRLRHELPKVDGLVLKIRIPDASLLLADEDIRIHKVIVKRRHEYAASSNPTVQDWGQQLERAIQQFPNEQPRIRWSSLPPELRFDVETSRSLRALSAVRLPYDIPPGAIEAAYFTPPALFAALPPDDPNMPIPNREELERNAKRIRGGIGAGWISAFQAEYDEYKRITKDSVGGGEASRTPMQVEEDLLRCGARRAK